MSAIALRKDFSSSELRGLARESRNNRQTRRFLALAAVADGMSREQAARIGGMDRQTLRDWVHRFNAEGPDGLLDRPRLGRGLRPTEAKLQTLSQIVDAGPDLEKDGATRWRRIDLQRVIKERFDVDYSVRTITDLLVRPGYSWISGRPRHPGQDPAVIDAFKKTSPGR